MQSQIIDQISFKKDITPTPVKSGNRSRAGSSAGTDAKTYKKNQQFYLRIR
jgi:hypothetical protein